MGPLVPTDAWKQGLIEVYAPVLDALDATEDDVSTRNDGSIYIKLPDDVDFPDIEAAGVWVLSTSQTKRGWHVINEAGMTYARENHPSEGKKAPTASKRELSPEEQARRDRAARLREQMKAIREAQKAEQDDDDDASQDDSAE